ncbi:hypothetical protein STAPHY8AQ_70462 [Staphylococcus sp. 8AQ]|nr:hypothetical protein STAPHY8AQ_70462 [Staphylococcus sp. 8AQ]
MLLIFDCIKTIDTTVLIDILYIQKHDFDFIIKYENIYLSHIKVIKY